MTSYGFVYLWYDNFRHMFYVGSHHGSETDGYLGSSRRFRRAYERRPDNFRRRIIERNTVDDRRITIMLEQRWLFMIKVEELGKRYYNLCRRAGGGNVLECAEVRDKHSISQRTKIISEKELERLKTLRLGQKNSLEHNQKIRDARLGSVLPVEWRRNTSIGMRKSAKRMAYYESRRGIPFTPERCANISAGRRRQIQRDATRRDKGD